MAKQFNLSRMNEDTDWRALQAIVRKKPVFRPTDRKRTLSDKRNEGRVRPVNDSRGN